MRNFTRDIFSNAFIVLIVAFLATLVGMFYDVAKSTAVKTIEDRWTKSDHDQFEVILYERIRLLEKRIDKLERNH